MKSHYSQTGMSRPWQAFIVLLPYEITLFSNRANGKSYDVCVLLPYEITLFSNTIIDIL